MTKMNFIDKERTLEQRESLSIWLWFLILASGGTVFALMVEGLCILSVPVGIVLLILVMLELKNNKYMGELIKEDKTINKDKKEP